MTTEEPKSKEITIVLSLLPGLGHYYLGQVNRGLQLFVAFFGCWFLLELLQVDIWLLLVAIYIFGIYDVIQQFDRVVKKGMTEDIPIVRWNERTKAQTSWVGWLLILLGCYLILDRLLPQWFGPTAYETLRISLGAILLILLGIRLVTGSWRPFSTGRKGRTGR
ncbi:hypothetical protein CEN49_26165 [Fischerella thermalis CCMEE 5273]|nr:hypothetical protein CEN49_26165 [Fischerella thermalis CCMEE 5273]